VLKPLERKLLSSVVKYTACTKMIGEVSSGHNGFGNARRSMFPTWNKAAGIQVLTACAIPLTPTPLTVTLQRENSDSGAESVLCAADCIA
jgi:hypothetical protein